MDITEAYDILNKYYSEDMLKILYRDKKFDSSGTDTIEKYKFHAELLRKESRKVQDINEAKLLNSAAKIFDQLYDKEFSLR